MEGLGLWSVAYMATQIPELREPEHANGFAPRTTLITYERRKLIFHTEQPLLMCFSDQIAVAGMRLKRLL